MIDVQGLTKMYRLYRSPKDRLIEAFSVTRRKYHQEFFALNNVSFDVEQGETVGIVGRNGSGKSTLLKIIAGVVRPTVGRVQVGGRVSSLLELGAGFQPEFTGRENAFINGALMGFNKRDMEGRLPEIERFASIGNFFDQPVKQYSSGMFVRLAFSVAINVDPQILIVDEALAVGDAQFKRKCYARLEELKNAGTTILFVSHDMTTITTLCHRAILLNGGRILAHDSPHEITRQYKRLVFGASEPEDAFALPADRTRRLAPRGGQAPEESDIAAATGGKVGSASLPTERLVDELRYGSGEVQIAAVGIRADGGETTTILESGKRYAFYLRAKYRSAVPDIVASVAIKNTKGLVIAAAATRSTNVVVGPRDRGAEVEISFLIETWLTPGEYFLDAEIRKDVLGDIYDRRDDVLQFKVVTTSGFQGSSWGVVTLPQTVVVRDLS